MRPVSAVGTWIISLPFHLKCLSPASSAEVALFSFTDWGRQMNTKCPPGAAPQLAESLKETCQQIVAYMYQNAAMYEGEYRVLKLQWVFLNKWNLLDMCFKPQVMICVHACAVQRNGYSVGFGKLERVTPLTPYSGYIFESITRPPGIAWFFKKV